MSKTLVGLLLVTLLGAGLLYLLRADDSDGRLREYPERDFAVEREADIARVFVADLTGRTLDLERQGDGSWLVNDSVTASPTIMEQVTRTLKELRIDHVPPRATADAVREAMASNALKVEAFDPTGRKLTGLLIGHSAPRGAGSYMVVDGYDEVFAVRRGLLAGSVKPQFDIRDVRAWQTRAFIAYEPAAIRSVEVRYPREASESFRILRQGETLTLEPLSDLARRRAREPQRRRLESYLEAFTSVSLKLRAEDFRLRDSVSAMVPLAQIVIDAPPRRDTFELQPSLKRSGTTGLLDPDLPVEDYWVERNGTDFVLAQVLLIDPLLRTYSSFFPE